MPRRGAPALQGDTRTKFRLSEIFPEHNKKRGPLEKQGQILEAIRSGQLQGGGSVYQGGKGSGKTIIGSAATVTVHHVPKWQGMTSLIGRESYPSLVTSTADEFFQMVKALPDRLIKSASKPSRNSMGFVEWAVGGKTLLCSLKDSSTWESANLGFAWVDEAHRQNERVCRDLETRLRQNNSPRTILYTTNPGGKGFLWKKAHPDAKNMAENWMWVEAASADNPTLDQDYLDRLVQVYGYMTPAYKRWVLGLSTALEGSVFTEFIPDVSDCVHVVPDIELPKDWYRGRGLDYGVVNPTAVVWGAQDPESGDWWIERVHYAPKTPDERHEWSVARHAEMILDTDADLGGMMDHVPADPSCWACNLPDEQTQSLVSVAEKFQNCGVSLTQANNDREQGLGLMLDMIAIDPNAQHPCTLEMGSPKMFILDREENEPLIDELQRVEWKRPEGTTEEGRPDDIRKKNDHAFDACRYLFMESPPDNISVARRKPIRKARSSSVVGSRGQVRYN